MAARRDRILDAAAAILAVEGSDGLSMRNLAEAAGVSVNTIYNLIGPRDAVIAALVERVIGLIEPAVEHAGGDDPVARCVAVIDRSASLVVDNEVLTRPLAHEIFGHGGPGSARSRQWGTSTLGRAITDAVDAGVLTEPVSPAAVAETVYAVWANSALSWAQGSIDGEGFRVASLHGLHLALLALATDASRPRLEAALAEVGAHLDSSLDTIPQPFHQTA